MNGRPDFLQELKRRKVVRAALVYGAVAFAVLQAADLVFPMLGLPDWSVKLVLGLLALGFPVVLALAWVFEMQEGQFTRTQSDATAAVAPAASWVGARTIAAALLLVGLGLAAGWVLRPDSVSTDGTDASLAVLPFENIGGAEANVAFAVGLHDDLLTQLSRIADLRLVSRTSVREYENTTKNLRDIAKELGVSTVLEGSVQRDAQRIRINVQLIEGETDRHLWAETYDKDLTVANIFAIQGEIAAAIAQALRAELGTEEQAAIAAAPTENMHAYDAYLRGLASGFWSYDSAGATSFEEARRIDPDFAEAWAGEARSKVWLARTANAAADGVLGARLAAEARTALDVAIRLAPAAIETKFARGYYAYYIDWDFAEALGHFEEIQRAQPNRADVLVAIAQVHRRMGRHEDALETYKRAALLDKRDAHPQQEIGTTGVVLHRFEEALRGAQIAESLHPGWADNLGTFTAAYVGLGDTASARAFLRNTQLTLEDAPSLTTDNWLLLDATPALAAERFQAVLADSSPTAPTRRWHAAVTWAHRLGRADLQRQYAEKLRNMVEPQLAQLPESTDPRVRSDHHRLLGIAYAYLGDKERALHHARTAIELVPCTLDSMECLVPQNDLLDVLVLTGHYKEAIAHARSQLAGPSWWSVGRMRVDPITKPLRADPEFQALLRK